MKNKQAKKFQIDEELMKQCPASLQLKNPVSKQDTCQTEKIFKVYLKKSKLIRNCRNKSFHPLPKFTIC